MHRLVTGLLQPTFLLYLLTALGVALLWRKRQESRRRLLWLTVAFLALTLLCVPAVGHLALGTLEWPYPPLEQRPQDAEAIVVLAGYVIPPSGSRSQAELGEDTLRRCVKAMELYRQGKACPVLVSGGKVNPDDPGPTCAEAMRDFLVRVGVKADDVILEGRSRDTFENAVESCKLLRERGLRKVVLVTDATHLHRALACFRRQGFEAVPCGCRYRAVALSGSVFDFLPRPAAARGLEDACHERLGTVWYWVQGRL
jgi:uncharacterized SAM-binding protein YcdF (DUF218 family)